MGKIKTNKIEFVYSTRGGVTGASFSKVVIDGYADDGGLYVPMELPKFDISTLRRCSSYSELAFTIYRKFISVAEISDRDLRSITADSYKEFPANPVPVQKLKNGTFAIELFHGPTFCFKDLGQQVLCRFINHFLTNPRVLVASTTGDTGPAAVHAVCSLK